MDRLWTVCGPGVDGTWASRGRPVDRSWTLVDVLLTSCRWRVDAVLMRHLHRPHGHGSRPAARVQLRCGSIGVDASWTVRGHDVDRSWTRRGPAVDALLTSCMRRVGVLHAFWWRLEVLATAWGARAAWLAVQRVYRASATAVKAVWRIPILQCLARCGLLSPPVTSAWTIGGRGVDGRGPEVDSKWTDCGRSVDLAWTRCGRNVDATWTRARSRVAERALRTHSLALEPSLPLEPAAGGTCWTLEVAEARLPSVKT